MKNNYIKFIIGFLIVALLGVGIYFSQRKEQIKMSYNSFMDNVNNNKVNEVILKNSPNIKVMIKDNDNQIFLVPNPRSEEFKEFLLKHDIEVKEDETANFYQIFQIVFFLAGIVVVYFYMYKRFGSVGSKAKMDLEVEQQENHLTRFNDIAGNDEAKESVMDLVDFIKKPQKYTKYGARMPRGIIFYGPPGTGKTLMAKAIAGEAGVSFFSVSGSDFVQMYVGVGASRVRDLFKKAREQGKAVIFIDEIDALGRKRGSATSSNDERDQTLNALLTEMSGFNANEGIIVIAATNRLDILDSALLRPGRFDRQVEIGLPDVNAREKILRLHIENKPVSSKVDLKKLAKQTVYFSGAMLENLVNEAAIFAAKANDKKIYERHIDKAFYTIVAGAEKKDKSTILEQDRKITAFHEAGHALMTKIIAPNHTVSKVTIIPSSKGAGGFSMNIPPDKMYMTKNDIKNHIMISLAGRASEEIIFGEEEVTTGASNDIEKATSMIKDFVNKYGMSQSVGLLNMSVLTQNNQVHNDIIKECKILIDDFYNRAKELIIQNKYYLSKIAEALLIKETLTEEDIDAVLNDEDIINSENEELNVSQKLKSKLKLKKVNTTEIEI